MPKEKPDHKYLLRDKAERFIAELYVALRRYPKSERHVLAARHAEPTGMMREIFRALANTNPLHN